MVQARLKWVGVYYSYMSQDTCKYPPCDKETREKGELEYPDSDVTASNGEPFRVDSFGANFCSTKHELKYEDAKADAEDAKRFAEEEPDNHEEMYEPEGPPF